MSYFEIFCCVFMIAVLGGLILLIRKGVIRIGDLSLIKDAIGSVQDVIDAIPADTGLFDTLVDYVMQAVHAVEQMYKNGEIKAEDRKDAAIELVKGFALVDGITVTKEHIAVVSNLIEAECDLMGHDEMIVENTIELADGIDLADLSLESLVSFCVNNGFGLPDSMVGDDPEVCRQMLLSYLDNRREIANGAPGVSEKPPEADCE